MYDLANISQKEIAENIRNGFTYVVSCTDKPTLKKIKNRYFYL